MRVRALKLSMVAILAVSCQKSSKSNDPSTTETDTTDKNAGTIAISLPESPDGAFSVAQTSLTTALEVDGAKGALAGGGAGYTPGTIAVQALHLDAATSCSKNGSPVHSDSSKNMTSPDGSVEMRRDLPEYPGALFYCKLNYNSYTHETIQGAYEMSRMMVCGTKGALKFNQDPVMVSLAPDDACIVDPEFKAMVAESEANGGLGGKWEFQILMKKPSARAAEGWDYDLYAGDFRAGVNDQTLAQAMVRASFKNSDETVGFAFYTAEPDGSGIGGDTYALSIKLGDKALLSYEARRQFVECASGTNCQSGNRKYTRHTRIVAEGKTDGTGKFLSLNKFEGIASIFDWGNSASLSTDPDGIKMFTMRGSARNGFKAQSYFSDQTQVAVSSPLSVLVLGAADGSTCYGGDQKCESISPLAPSTDADMSFLLDPRGGTVVRAKAWFDALKPINFNVVTFAGVQN